ncbi:MAG: nucleotide-binding protein [Cyanobacteriota bacterium]|nr:nucleotide-binding protein [Cyanobacteriota bacterium]
MHFFLEQVICHSDICQAGAILVNVPDGQKDGRGHLRLWDLTTDVQAINSLAKDANTNVDLPCDEGISTVAFRKRAPEFTASAKDHPQYWWPADSEMPDPYAEGPCYAVPIKLFDRRDRREPFGVVTFQNGPEQVIKEDDRKNMDLAVKALEAMMSLSPRKLVEEKKVFIVHGRDKQHREELEKILRKEDLDPVVIQSMARTGSDLLGFLEDKIRNCLAGFILLTPDDEGRLYQYGQELRQRARQNVIFEAGYLTALFRDTNRICFLKKGDLEIPSDLSGLLMETFAETLDPKRIHLTLKQWGIANPALYHELDTPSRKAQAKDQTPAPRPT